MESATLLVNTGITATRHGAALRFQEGLYQVSKQGYAWMVPNGSWGETNIGLIDCNGKSVLIDTGWDLNFTRHMLSAMQPVLARSPIETVINTHADGDHCWGNQLFKGRDIVATRACQEQMHHTKPAALNALQHSCKALRYVPFGGMKCFSHYMDDMLAPYHFQDVQITDPTITFQQEHNLCLNGKDIILYEVGPGHTDGDAIVHVPDDKLVYAGDIAFIGITPVMWSGPLENLVAGLHKLLSLKADIMVPGHGPLASRQDIQNIIDYWDFVHEGIHALYQQDMLPHEAASHVMHSKAFLQSPYARWDCAERMVTNAFTLYRHWGARLRNLPEPMGTLDILRKQARVAQSVAPLLGIPPA
ncbi:MBL fold metallo-hydrolase [Ketobacter sp.]|uniref:MBL fold metallo-hydrolase n=1 Tax=Ketobacter sp. TaxID=2083498 RepID=UPI000F28D186|nr:MBL fold metallo-hydrolase [Ketobacter sp.]RLU01129.1 MAG: MBL fold metallo-hydrolase [Ketobacter sp.]